MATQYLTTEFPAVPSIRSFDPTVRTITIQHLSYDVWMESGLYYIKALHTGAVKAFRSREALNDFAAALRWHLAHKYAKQEPTPMAKAQHDLSVAFDRYFAAYRSAQPRNTARSNYQWNKDQSALKDAERAVGLAAQRYYAIANYEDAA